MDISTLLEKAELCLSRSRELLVRIRLGDSESIENSKQMARNMDECRESLAAATPHPRRLACPMTRSGGVPKDESP